MHINIYF